MMQLNQAEQKMDEISRQWTLLKHEYRSTRDDALKVEIKKKWDELQKKMERLEIKRQKIIEEKNKIELIKVYGMSESNFLKLIDFT